MNDLKKALSEQMASDNILAKLDRIAHYRYLEQKFGPKKIDAVEPITLQPRTREPK